MIDEDDKKMNPTPDDAYLGLTEPLTLQISIRKGLPDPLPRMTLIHELVHAFVFTYGYQIQDEEAMCEFFAAHADEILTLSDQVMKEVVINADNSRD